MSGCFFLKHGVHYVSARRRGPTYFLLIWQLCWTENLLLYCYHVGRRS